jgi:hypothetical protein
MLYSSKVGDIIEVTNPLHQFFGDQGQIRGKGKGVKGRQEEVYILVPSKIEGESGVAFWVKRVDCKLVISREGLQQYLSEKASKEASSE